VPTDNIEELSIDDISFLGYFDVSVCAIGNVDPIPTLCFLSVENKILSRLDSKAFICKVSPFTGQKDEDSMIGK
jgi:hypothetical protein